MKGAGIDCGFRRMGHLEHGDQQKDPVFNLFR
jgi:hypothetical protein